MSEHERPFTKKQIQTILKIVFLESMLIVLILPSNQSTGELATFQQSFGWAWVVILANGGGGGGAVIKFNPAFAGSPFPIGPEPFFQPWIVAWNITGGGNSDPNFQGQNPIQFNVFTHNKFGQNQTIWTSIPAATTEIFNTLNDRIAYNFSSTVSKVSFSVTLLQNTTTVGAFLQPQFSNDNGVTWRNLCPFACTVSRIPLTSNIGVPINTAWFATTLATQGLNLNIPYILRVVESGGANTQISIASMTLNVAQNLNIIPICETPTNGALTNVDVNHAEIFCGLPPGITIPFALNVTFGWSARSTTAGPTSFCKPTNTGTASSPNWQC